MQEERVETLKNKEKDTWSDLQKVLLRGLPTGYIWIIPGESKVNQNFPKYKIQRKQKELNKNQSQKHMQKF